jgi:hypothetical protein
VTDSQGNAITIYSPGAPRPVPLWIPSRQLYPTAPREPLM